MWTTHVIDGTSCDSCDRPARWYNEYGDDQGRHYLCKYHKAEDVETKHHDTPDKAILEDAAEHLNMTMPSTRKRWRGLLWRRHG